MPSTNVRPHRSTRALQAVPDPPPAGRTVAEDKLWAALHAYPASTTGDLAAHAGIGYSTAGKIGSGALSVNRKPRRGVVAALRTHTLRCRQKESRDRPICAQ
jgi:hypothetical protein